MTSAGALLVLADPFDVQAATFVEANAEADVLRVTPRDLSREGWKIRSGDPNSLIAVCGSRRIRRDEIRGVLPRLSHVDESQVPHIAVEDRAYVASEMTAFMLAFLSALERGVHNRPTSQSLCGPLWSPEHWRRLADALGIAVRFQPRLASLDLAIDKANPLDDAPRTVVTLVGDAVFGDARLGPAVAALARAARAEMLRAEFAGEGDDALFVHASPLVNLADRDIAMATLDLFRFRTSGAA
ncbi:hypothetical protein RZS28_03810 [Methylocapsa polymorpha]|uniref:Uncharacterized protein n=1 Tax=Methylocapsa polymorpha TaxID=3080828 RepID=A0ABZ0HU36_9HYPH|nr:hypothetical protein RZS28_03810 [Methylocapsa sp. RX1]